MHLCLSERTPHKLLSRTYFFVLEAKGTLRCQRKSFGSKPVAHSRPASMPSKEHLLNTNTMCPTYYSAMCMDTNTSILPSGGLWNCGKMAIVSQTILLQNHPPDPPPAPQARMASFDGQSFPRTTHVPQKRTCSTASRNELLGQLWGHGLRQKAPDKAVVKKCCASAAIIHARSRRHRRYAANQTQSPPQTAALAEDHSGRRTAEGLLVALQSQGNALSFTSQKQPVNCY